MDENKLKLPFQGSQSHMSKNKIFTLTYQRLFDPEAGKRWKRGELLQMVVGAQFPKADGGKRLVHSHKMEVRLGDVIGMPVKKSAHRLL